MNERGSDISPDDRDADSGGRAALVDACVRGDATPEQVATLRGLLRADPAAVDAYLDQVRVHALLEWRSGTVAARSPDDARRTIGPATAGRAQTRRHWMPWAAAAAVLLAASIAWVVLRRATPATGPVSPSSTATFADVTDLRDVVWDDGQAALALGSPVGTGEIAIRSGTLRLAARADAVVTVTGPARLRMQSASRVRVVAGHITTRVGPAGKGFIVDAPGADVVDLGTEFGVHVGPAGETAVVVFDGEVDLTPKPAASPDTRPAIPAAPAEAPIRLVKGQAVSVQPGGVPDRILSVARSVGGDWSLTAGADPRAVIAAVRDNRRVPADPKYYQIVRAGLTEDAPAYVDRSYQWNGLTRDGLPEALRGADLVMTFNDDKHAADLELTVTLARPATLYVLYKQTPIPTPDWLTRDFFHTGLTIGMDEGPPGMPRLRLGVGPGESVDHVFAVWQSDALAAGEVKLGPNSPQHNSMYGIAAVPLPERVRARGQFGVTKRRRYDGGFRIPTRLEAR